MKADIAVLRGSRKRALGFLITGITLDKSLRHSGLWVLFALGKGRSLGRAPWI